MPDVSQAVSNTYIFGTIAVVLAITALGIGIVMFFKNKMIKKENS